MAANRIWIALNALVRESQNLISAASHIGIPRRIKSNAAFMRNANTFDDDLMARANEISEVDPDRLLTAKFVVS